MIFRRRTPPPWREKLRVALWPRRSWSRSAAYAVKRVMRLSATPHSIAAGVAAGVFASFTPLMGFHFVIAFAVAYAISGNMIAAAMGTAVGNPVTFPAIWGVTYATGMFMLSGAHHPATELAPIHAAMLQGEGPVSGEAASIAAGMLDVWEPMLKPMLVGGVPLGILAGLLFYFPTRKLVASFQEARARRLAAASMPRPANCAQRS